MLRMHERTQKISLAQTNLILLVYKFQEENDLTDIELLQGLAQAEQSILKYMLRYERHGDPEHKADEA